MKDIKTSSRKSVYAELKQFDVCAGEDDFIEITQWTNYEGFDVEIIGKLQTRFQLTFGEFEAVKKLVKALEKTNSNFTVKDEYK